jgi:hypothetical protein
VQWGVGNYCDNRDAPTLASDRLAQMQRELAHKGSPNAEVAAWDHRNTWLKLGEYDDVIGWQTPEQVAAILAYVSSLPRAE